MTPSKLLRFLLSGLFPRVVEEGGGGVAEAVEEVAEDAVVEEAPAEAEKEEAAAEGEAEPEPEDEVIVTIGDEHPPEEDQEQQQAPAWVKDLRKSNREKDRKLREQEAEIARLKGSKPADDVVLGEKPTLAASDYDEEKFEAALSAWHDRKRQVDDAKQRKADAERKAQEAWQAKLKTYAANKTALRVRDFEDAEEPVLQTLNTMQQGVIVQGSKNAALVVYALGRNPKKLKELAAITDPVEFAVAVGELGAQLKVQSRKPATLPEKVAPRSSMSGASAVDNQLAKLQEQAAKTGDRTQVIRYLAGKAKQAA